MNLALSPDRLRFELARRGLSQSQFAVLAGISEPTVSHGMTGKAISEATLAKMARTLAAIPPLPGVDALLAAR